MRTNFSVQTFFTLLLTGFMAILPVGVAHANVGYGGGEYTNLCGSGTAASFYNCPGSCSTGNGSCSAGGNYVVRYVCDGRQTECRSNESGFSTSQSVGGVGCGKTVQVDVFNKTCRVNGNWVCGSNNLTGYMVWYSGNCSSSTPTPTPVATPTPSPTPTTSPTPTPTPSPTPTPTPVPQISSCDSLQVASGNSSKVPAKVVLRARGSDNMGGISQYRYYFGDGTRTETAENEITHTYDSSGTYLVRADIRDSRGNWKSSSSCETTVYVYSSPIESHRSGCSDLYITEGQSQQPPVTVHFKVSGYDNKGNIQRYKLDFGNGIVKETDGQTFEQIYEKSGTYTVIGSVKDSEGNWQNSDSCRTTLYVNTKPINEQPKTGTPTLWTTIGLMSGSSGALLSILYWPTKRHQRRR